MTTSKDYLFATVKATREVVADVAAMLGRSFYTKLQHNLAKESLAGSGKMSVEVSTASKKLRLCAL